FTLLLCLILKPLEITDDVVYPHRYNVLVVEVKPLPFQKSEQMILPVIEVNISFHIVFAVVRKSTHDQEVHHNTHYVTGNLNRNAELKEPVGVQQIADNEYAQHLIQRQCVPEYVGTGVLKLVLQESAHRKIDGVPETEDEVCPFPYPRYIV